MAATAAGRCRAACASSESSMKNRASTLVSSDFTLPAPARAPAAKPDRSHPENAAPRTMAP